MSDAGELSIRNVLMHGDSDAIADLIDQQGPISDWSDEDQELLLTMAAAVPDVAELLSRRGIEVEPGTLGDSSSDGLDGSLVAELEAGQRGLFAPDVDVDDSLVAELEAGQEPLFEIDTAAWAAWFASATDEERRAAWDGLAPGDQLVLSTVDEISEWRNGATGSSSSGEAAAPDGDYAWVGDSGDLFLFTVDDLHAVQGAWPPDRWTAVLRDQYRAVAFLPAGEGLELPQEGIGEATVANGVVTSWEYAVGAAALDPAEVRRRNLAVLNAMVARDADEDARTAELLFGNDTGELLLGGGHSFAALQSLGADVARGTVRFHRNRTSANELRLAGGEFELGGLDQALRSLLADPACTYPYRDRERVVIH
jgi:hypothetical protein